MPHTTLMACQIRNPGFTDPDDPDALGLLRSAPRTTAIMDSVAAEYARITRRPTPSREDLAALAGSTVTLLVYAQNPAGEQSLSVFEAVLVQAIDDKLFLLDLHSVTLGWMLDSGSVLDAEPAEGRTDAMRERLEHVRATLPVLEELTAAHLLALPQDAEDTDSIQLSVFGCGRTEAPGTGGIWLLHSCRPEDAIAHGYLLSRPGDGVSGPGSVPVGQLLARSGRIVNPPALSIAETRALLTLPYPQALARFVNPGPHHP